MHAVLDAGVQERDRVREGSFPSCRGVPDAGRSVAEPRENIPVCLVKKNEMLYSERDLYIFTKNRGVESSSANAGRERMMYRLLKKWSSYGKRKNNL